MEVIDETIRDYPELTSAVVNCFDVIIFTLWKTAGKSVAEKSYKLTTLNMIAYDCFDTIRAAHRLILIGYYESAIKLLRPAFESSYLLSYLGTLDEKSFEVDKAFYDEVLSAGKPKEINIKIKKLDEIQREKFLYNLWLDTNDKNDSTIKNLYSNYFSLSKLIEFKSETEVELECEKMGFHRSSQFTHSTFYGLITRLNKEPGKLKLGCLYDADDSLNCLKEVFKMTIRLSNELRKYFGVLDINEVEYVKLDRMDKDYKKFV